MDVLLDSCLPDLGALRLEQALQLLRQSGQELPPGAPGSIAWLQGLVDALCDLSSRDALTGLANRVLFDEHLATSLKRARIEHRVVSVLYFDLDRFKQINDTRGHAVGDALLKAVSNRVSEQLRTGDLLARRGGDEFTAVSVAGDAQESVALGERILACFGAPFEVGGEVLHVTASIGVAADAGGDLSPDELVARADAALYRAKERGRNRVEAHAA